MSSTSIVAITYSLGESDSLDLCSFRVSVASGIFDAHGAALVRSLSLELRATEPG